MQDKRSEVRLLCADMLEIEWRTLSGQTRRATALLEDISKSGACLQVETALPPGTELMMRCRKGEYAANVKYCVYREIGYFVGIEFSDSTKWSVRNFRPAHLLDLQKLAASARQAEAE